MNERGNYGSRTSHTARGCQRGEYCGSRPSTRPVPVIVDDVNRAPGAALLTTFVAIWDPAAERIAGGGPSYYTQHDGGWWYFPHPEGEVWLGGRRFRPIRPLGPVMVIESDPSLRVSGVQIAKAFFSRSDFEQGIKQLDLDFNTFMNEAISIMGGDPKDFTRTALQKSFGDPKYAAKLKVIEKSPLYPFYNLVLVPLYNEWNAFLEKPVGITEAITESLFSGPFGSIGPSALADKLKRWQERLVEARTATDVELSKIKKPQLRSPGSVALPKSWFEKGEEAAEKAGAGLADIGKVLKYVLIGVAAVGGVVVVSQLASSLKKGREGKEVGPSYIERFRERRTHKPKVIEADTVKAVETKVPWLALPAASTG